MSAPYVVELRNRGRRVAVDYAATIDGLVALYRQRRAQIEPSKTWTFHFYNIDRCEMDGERAFDGLTDDEREAIECAEVGS